MTAIPNVNVTLTKNIMVLEAHQKSGAIITIHLALDDAQLASLKMFMALTTGEKWPS